jgi:hypothetical protein
MRFFALLIEVILPLLLIGTITFVIYKYMTLASSKKQWLKELHSRKDKRYKLSFNEIQEDWAKFFFFSNSNLPPEVMSDLAKVTQALQSISNKAIGDKWDVEENKLPRELYPVVDVLYKHFPDLINEYRQIPKNIADNKKNLAGKTATQLLIENSQLLVTTVENKIQELFTDNLNKMTSQQYHFKDKFEEKELEL